MKTFREGMLKGLGFSAGVALFVSLSALIAQTVTTFNSGEVISASGINANFTALVNRLNAPLPRAASASSGSFSTTSTSFANVTNLSISVTSSGSPIWIGLTPDGTGNDCVLAVEDFSGPGSAHGQYALLRDGAIIEQWAVANPHSVGASDVQVPCGAIWTIDEPGAGTYTYKIQARSVPWGANDRTYLANAKLNAFRFNE